MGLLTFSQSIADAEAPRNFLLVSTKQSALLLKTRLLHHLVILC